MKKITLAIGVLFALMVNVTAQKVYQTKAGKVRLFSATALENIEGINNQADSKLATNGQMIFSVLIKGFRFPNATMQEHFNENYIESDKFPKAAFQGKIANLAAVNFEKDGSYNVTVAGTLEIHGVKQQVSTTGKIDIVGGKPQAKSIFKVKLADYGIKGTLIGEKIAKEIEITVDCKYD